MKRRFGIGSVLTLLVTVSWTFAQNAPPTMSSSSDVTLAPRSPAENSSQHFVCSRDFTIKSCYKDVAVLRRILNKYPVAQIGEWTWILVRSKDWKAIVSPRGLDPDSPAFTYSAKRQTFIEEALVEDVPRREVELIARWHLRADELRELVVTHELGHAFCKDRSEVVANQQAERVRNGKSFSCESNAGSKFLVEEANKSSLFGAPSPD